MEESLKEFKVRSNYVGTEFFCYSHFQIVKLMEELRNQID